MEPEETEARRRFRFGNRETRSETPSREVVRGLSVGAELLRPAGTRTYEPFGPSGFGSKGLVCGYCQGDASRQPLRMSI